MTEVAVDAVEEAALAKVVVAEAIIERICEIKI